MPRLTRIYTRTGDGGETALGSGRRVPKDSPRIEAYGSVDELNSAIGVAIASDADLRIAAMLQPIQNELFHLGSDLCFTEEDKKTISIPQIESKHVDQLETWLDALAADLKPLENFIIPGGAPAAAHLHLARCVCRRAERILVALRRDEAIGAQAIPYLNRLSDLLFVMARYENHKKGRADVCWDSRA